MIDYLRIVAKIRRVLGRVFFYNIAIKLPQSFDGCGGVCQKTQICIC